MISRSLSRVDLDNQVTWARVGKVVGAEELLRCERGSLDAGFM